MRWLAPLAILLAGCVGDETLSGYADPGPWQLIEIDGGAVATRATLTFPEEGRVAGTLPCGTWTAQQTAPYPWFLLSHFDLGGCPRTVAEERVVQALASVTLAEAQGDVLILSNEDGLEMLFRTGPPS